MIPTSRRTFLRHSALATFSGGVLLNRLVRNLLVVIADTTLGGVRGVDSGGIKTFKGIPYGASTAGANRFMPPSDPQKWAGVRDALEYGHSAPQRDPSAPPPAPGVERLRIASSDRRRRLPGAECLDSGS